MTGLAGSSVFGRLLPREGSIGDLGTVRSERTRREARTREASRFAGHKGCYGPLSDVTSDLREEVYECHDAVRVRFVLGAE